MYRILIVDDNVINLDFLRMALCDEYKLSLAKNGKIALKIAERLHPDLILLDINMPIMNGYDAYNELKKSDVLKHIPVVFLTGEEVLDYQLIDGDHERIDFFTKPFDIGSIKAYIENLLS